VEGMCEEAHGGSNGPRPTDFRSS